ncbi:MAG TPA: class I SAM-dependent methyltransferase [Flavisolibacter sp.]|nr:class I SAM-dependent methyltransferase [Flavisolibacter sp.]
MSIQQAYNQWADQYDNNVNKTRDLEAIALRKTLEDAHFNSCLEIGCGTGKNTEWLLRKAESITSVDFSFEMLQKAREKITSSKVKFIQADIMKEWSFCNGKYDLMVFSLVLEHIENLAQIFCEASKYLSDNGKIYIGELHPFKQYSGSKARFGKGSEEEVLDCYTHHISDFVQSAKNHNFHIDDLNEFFDVDATTTLPRILTLVFRKNVNA